jgi:hypothetical protein
MRIKASEMRAFLAHPDQGAMIFKEAFAWVNVTDQIRLEPHGFTGGTMGIKLIYTGSVPEDEVHVWRPGEPVPVEVKKDRVVYRVDLVHKNLAVFACWE